MGTRKVDEPLQALDLTRIDKRPVSCLFQELEQAVEMFQQRTGEGHHPYLWLDALSLKVRANHPIVSQPLVIAIGVWENEDWDVLRFTLGASERCKFWLESLRRLVRRWMDGARSVITDTHEDPKGTIEQVLSAASLQRFRVHFMRSLLARIPQAVEAMVAAAVSTIFTQPTLSTAGDQLAKVVAAIRPSWPEACEFLRTAEDDILACMAFPSEHWTLISPTQAA